MSSCFGVFRVQISSQSATLKSNRMHRYASNPPFVPHNFVVQYSSRIYIRCFISCYLIWKKNNALLSHRMKCSMRPNWWHFPFANLYHFCLLARLCLLLPLPTSQSPKAYAHNYNSRQPFTYGMQGMVRFWLRCKVINRIKLNHRESCGMTHQFKKPPNDKRNVTFSRGFGKASSSTDRYNM